MKNLKQTIKEMAAEQSSLKNQRKTVRITGERTMTAKEAWSKHQTNRETLRELYMAYGIMRGRTPEQIETNPKEPINMKRVNTLIEQYTPVEQAA